MRLQKVWTMQVSLLVLGLFSLMISLSSAQDLRYQNLVNQFISDYNKKEGSENIFRLSTLTLEPGENNDDRPVRFTIKETVCLKTENINPDDCDFKENGVVKECTGTIALDSTQPSVNILCDKPERIKRRFGKLKKILKKVGKSLPRIIIIGR